MSDEKLQELLSVLPDEDEVAYRAARARLQALARIEEPRSVHHRLVWAPGLALAALVLIVAVIVFRGSTPIPSMPITMESSSPETQQDRLRMKWVLSDGTRVLWTFRKDLNL